MPQSILLRLLERFCKVGGALILGEVIGDQIDNRWISNEALAYLALAFFAKEESVKKTFLAVAVGSQLKEVSDMTGVTQQIKGLVPQAALGA